jgi:hypothetical protein
MKKLTLSLLIVPALLLLGGCGNSGDSTSGPTTASDCGERRSRC